jgi:probable biosynthetic protein (TIGR04098 family)
MVEFVSERQMTLNMPQMAIGGLSEGWLFRELGDMHWQSICRALGTPSHAICDDQGNRLYATFIRFRWEGSDHLKSFRENESLLLTTRLSRYGTSVFFSDCAVVGDMAEVRATLMTTFALRESDNKSLLRGAPAIIEQTEVPAMQALPEFGIGYRAMRAGHRIGVELAGDCIDMAGEPLFETEYRLNPYQDFNGVNLLYFAVYPTIADVCERDFVHRQREAGVVSEDWALDSATVARDVYYYGNCPIDDVVLFQLRAFHQLPNKRVTLAATLRRLSDGRPLADVFAVKMRGLHAAAANGDSPLGR